MLKLLAVFAVALLLAYISEKNTEAIMATGQKYTVWKDWAYILLVVILVFCVIIASIHYFEFHIENFIIRIFRNTSTF